MNNNSLIYPLSTSSKTTLTTRCADALLTLPVHRAFGASDPARASRLRRFYPCPCIAPSALLLLPVHRAFGASAPACDYRASRDPSIPLSSDATKRADAPLRRLRADANIGAQRPGYTRVTSTHASPVAPPARGCPRAPARGVRRRARQPANTAF